MYFPYHKYEETQVLNGLTCILSEELLINPNNFITISGIERYNMGIWDKYKCTFTDPNELHNQESMEGMFKGTGLLELNLDQYPQGAFKNKMGKFDEADIQKSYTQVQGKGDETVTIEIISRQIERKLQARAKTSSPPGLNIAPTEYPSITSGLTQESAEFEDTSLLGGAYLALDLSGENISLLGDEAYLTVGDVY